MSQDIIDRINRLFSEFDRRVQAAPADSWGNASPCEGWTATDVVNHVVSNVSRITGALGGTVPAASDNPVEAWNGVRDAFLGCLPTADLDTPIPAGPMGELPAHQFLGRFVANDVLVHTWDLARAVGGDERLDADFVAAAYSGLKPLDQMIRQPGIFGPKIAAEGVDLQTEFLSFLGRTV